MKSPPIPPLQLPEHWKVLLNPSIKSDAASNIPAPSEKIRILIAEDERICREVLANRLDQAGYHVIVTRDGEAALEELRKPDAPPVAILDWLMPGTDGPTICQRMRAVNKAVYLILLTSRDRKEDLVEGLDSGADDYLVKPVKVEELLARVKVGLRIIGMQRALTERISHLETPERGESESSLGLALV
jgi:DNA-binding response OmpR family regulator